MRKRVPQTDPSKAVAYLRISPREQHTGLGLETQRRMITSWATKNRVWVIAWFTDKDISGDTDLEGREGFTGALATLKQHHAGLLLVSHRDRLARDVFTALLLGREVEQQGAKIVSADGTPYGDSPNERFTRTVLDASSEHTLALIRLRTKEALQAKKKRGEVYGEPPFGMKKGPGGRLVTNEAEVTARSMMVYLHDRGWSYTKISQAMAKQEFISRSGHPFRPAQIRYLLKKDR